MTYVEHEPDDIQTGLDNWNESSERISINLNHLAANADREIWSGAEIEVL